MLTSFWNKKKSSSLEWNGFTLVVIPVPPHHHFLLQMCLPGWLPHGLVGPRLLNQVAATVWDGHAESVEIEIESGVETEHFGKPPTASHCHEGKLLVLHLCRHHEVCWMTESNTSLLAGFLWWKMRGSRVVLWLELPSWDTSCYLNHGHVARAQGFSVATLEIYQGVSFQATPLRLVASYCVFKWQLARGQNWG